MQKTIAIKEDHLQEGAPIEEEMIKEEARDQTAVAAIASEREISTEGRLESEIPKPLETHSIEMTLNSQETAEMTLNSQETAEMTLNSQETAEITLDSQGSVMQMATDFQEKAETKADSQEIRIETKADSQ